MAASVISRLTQPVILFQSTPQAGRINLPPINQLANELCLYKAMAPNVTRSGRQDTCTRERRNRRLERRVITPVRTVVVPAVNVLAFGTSQALLSLFEKLILILSNHR